MRSVMYICVSILFFLCFTNAVYALSFGDKDLTRPIINNSGTKKGNFKALILDSSMEKYDANLVDSMPTIRAYIKGNSVWQWFWPTIDFQGSTGWQRNWDLTPYAEQFRGKSSYSFGRGYRSSGMITLENEILTAETTPAPVPEPGTMILLGTGLLVLAGFGRKTSLKK